MPKIDDREGRSTVKGLAYSNHAHPVGSVAHNVFEHPLLVAIAAEPEKESSERTKTC